MICRFLRPCAAALFLALAVPGVASAQVGVGAGVGPPGWGPGGWTGPGGPMWTYPGLPGGPYAPGVSPLASRQRLSASSSVTTSPACVSK